MSKKNRIPRRSAKPGMFQLDDQFYVQSATGQVVRINQQGQQISRTRMSKKEKLKLRKELHNINEMDSHELANKIVDSVGSVSVVNPKTEEQLKNEKREIEQYA